MSCCSDCSKTGGHCGSGNSKSTVDPRGGLGRLGVFDLYEWTEPYLLGEPQPAFEGQRSSSAGPLTLTPADRILASTRAELEEQRKFEEGFLGISGDTWLMIGAGVVVVGALMGGRRR